MPRHARLKVPGHPLHVYQRGHDKKPCFATTADKTLYLALLAESSRLYSCLVHAFVLMTNHVHLLISPSDPEDVARMMKRLNERYAMHFNKRMGRTGAVWEGRYKTCLVDSDVYLLRLQRYIELNPVRAAMVLHPADYPWSSYRTHAYGDKSELLSAHSLYLSMGSTGDERQLRYRRFISGGSAEAELLAIRGATCAGVPLASPQFLAQLPSECQLTARPMGRPKKVRTAGEPIPLYGKPGLSRF
jgi:putative transposase